MSDQFRASVTRSAISVQPQKPRLSSMFANLSKKTTAKKATVAKKDGRNQKKQGVKSSNVGANLKKSLDNKRGQSVKDRRAADQAKSRQKLSGTPAPKQRTNNAKKVKVAKPGVQNKLKRLSKSKKTKIPKNKRAPKADDEMCLDEQLDRKCI